MIDDDVVNDDDLAICEESAIEKIENEKFNNMLLRNNFFKEQILSYAYADNFPSIINNYDIHYRCKIQSYISVNALNTDIEDENNKTMRSASILFIYNYLKSIVDKNPKKEIDIMNQLDNIYDLQSQIIDNEINAYIEKIKNSEKNERRKLIQHIQNQKEIEVHDDYFKVSKNNNKKFYKSALRTKSESLKELHKTCTEFIKNTYNENKCIDVDPEKFNDAIQKYVVCKIRKYLPEEKEIINKIMVVMFDNISKDETSQYYLPKR